jgi:uncharacterized protein (TIGR03437 family)
MATPQRLRHVKPVARALSAAILGLFAAAQAGAATTTTPWPVLAAVVNAASFQPGPLAPGEVITLFGDGLGPDTPSAAVPNANGAIDVSLATTRVLINGLSAPVLYTSKTQVTAVVPFSLQPGTPVTMQVDYQTFTSTPLIGRIAQSSPGIFTATQTGKDQAAALNENGSLNGPNNPAAPGSIVSLFVSGGGQTRPASTDGVISGSSGNAAAPVTATVAGAPADVVYAGPAPGLISGAFQVNVRLPGSTPSGNHVFIALHIGNADSLPGTTIAVSAGGSALPDSPSSFAAAAGAGGVTLSWRPPPAGVVRVHVERSSTNGAFSEIAATASTSSFVDTAVQPSAGYTYRARFETAAGYSEYSPGAGANLPSSYIAPPDRLTAAPLSAGSVFLSWNNRATDAVAISVERSTGDAFSELARVSGGAGSYRDTAVSASSPYSYRLRTVTAAGVSPPSQTADASTPAPPALPDIAPRIHPSDPHRLILGGATWTMAGYYPSLGAFTTDQTDYTYYHTLIDALAANGVNYFRIAFTMGQPYGNSINPYQRTGPGNAQDGRPRFDLTRFDQSYFDYWHDILQYANAKGLVLQICMMDGWHATADVVETDSGTLAWGLRYDYYNSKNNINGVNVTTPATLVDPTNSVFAYQRALLHKIVDTLGGFPNIVWEISNESISLPWELLLADDVTAYEQSKGGVYQHLVIPRDLPGHQYVPGQCDNTATGAYPQLTRSFPENLVLITDNDCVTDGTPDSHRGKAWGALTAGAQMDYFNFDITNPQVLASTPAVLDMQYVGLLKKFVADLNLDLAGMTPLDSEVSGGWALGRSGSEYVVYLPSGGATAVPALPSVSRATWFNPRNGESSDAGKGPQFQAPDGNDWVLYLLR